MVILTLSNRSYLFLVLEVSWFSLEETSGSVQMRWVSVLLCVMFGSVQTISEDALYTKQI
jgi:hypothetical protein